MTQSKKTYFLAALIASSFISSCATNTSKNLNQNDFMEPSAVVDMAIPRIEKNVLYGPKVTNENKSILENRLRDRIAEEKAKSYIQLDKNAKKLFPVSVNFQNASMHSVALMFSKITGVNIIVGDEVDNLVTTKLDNVSWDKALDAILKTRGLAKNIDQEANIIRIHKQDTLVSLEEFDRKRTEDLQRALQLERAVEPLFTEIFRLYYTNPDVVKSEILSVFGVASGGDSGGDDGSSAGSANPSSEGSNGPQITVDKRINSLIVKATNEELELIAKLIKKVDVRTKQILIEAFIVEASDDFDKALGARLGIDGSKTNINLPGGQNDNNTIRFGGVAGSVPDTAADLSLGDSSGAISNLPVSGMFGGLGLVINTSSTALKLELSAMEKLGLTKIVSNPRIFTLDNEEAIVFQGEEIPVESAAADGGTDVEFKEAGIKLTVTPSIVGDGNVILKVVINKDSPNWSNAVGNNPPIDKREISTRLLVQDKTVAVIGGVFKQETSDTNEKVPGLADIPIIGKAFKRDTKADARTELLIFLAPRII